MNHLQDDISSLTTHLSLMKYKFIFILFSFLFIEVQVLSQNIRFEQVSVEQGLSQASGYAALRDDNGFLWFGTQDGLNRFDGYSFLVFQNNLLDSTSVIRNHINTLFSYTKDLLWVGTLSGLDILDRRSGKFYRFHQFFNLKTPELQGQNIRKIIRTSQGKVWIMTWASGIYSFDDNTTRIQKYFDQEKQREQNREIFVDEKGNFWVATINALHRYDALSSTFQKFEISQYLKQETTTSIRAAACDKENNLWIGTSDLGVLVFKIDQKATLVKHFLKEKNENSLSSNNISCMLKDKNNHIWIGTRDGGISRYIPERGFFYQYVYSEFDTKSLNKNFVLSLYEDVQGIIWIGLSGGGFNKYDPRGQQFIHLKKQANKPNGLNDNMVFSIQSDSHNNLYIGSQSGGLVKINTQTGDSEVYKQETGSFALKLYNTVYGLGEDEEGKIWLATWGGLCMLDQQAPDKNYFITFSDEKIPTTTFLYQIHKIRDKNEFWVSGQNGVFRFDPKAKKWLDWQANSTFKALHKSVVRVFYEDEMGNLWMGTDGNGLLCYQLKNNKVKQYNAPDVLPSVTVRSLCKDKNNILWVGTDKGLVKFNTKTEKMVELYQQSENGLANNVIYGILTERDNVWVSTNKGLSCLNKKTRIFKNYDKEDGLQSNEFNTNTAYKSPEGLLYFGGINGITVFDPNQQINYYKASTKITSLKIFDKEYVSDTLINELKKVRLSYRENFFSIEFACLNHSMNSKNKYAYQLEGIDEDWVYCGTRRVASYTDLSFGNYTFKVKSANNDGIWGEETQLQIYITPPYWKEGWFRLLILLFASAAGYWFYQSRIRYIRKEAHFKQKMAEIEMSALRAQMNPHFIFNSLSSINYFMLTHDAETASKYLTKFAQLIRLILENARSHKVSLSKELEALNLYIDLEALRFDNCFDYRLEIDDTIDIEQTWIPPLILQPYIENAIWHGLMHKKEKGQLLLEIKQPKENFLFISIEDNGVGRQKAKELKSKSANLHRSFGMQITSDRIHLVNQLYNKKTSVEIIDLKNANNIAIGTKIEIMVEI